jgi:hypothetical protein
VAIKNGFCPEDNMEKIRCSIHIAFLVLILLAFSSEWLPAQSKPTIPVEKGNVAAGVYTPTNEAELASVREQLFKLLRMSPKLTTALSVDSTLLSYPDYVNRNNPELERFLQSHPEITRNPEFWLFAHLSGNRERGNRDILFQRAVWPEFVEHTERSPLESDLIPFFVFLIILSAILWLLRIYLQNRRWGRVFKVQTEIHTKLLDKFGGSQELFTYLGTDAGRKFLELAPIKAAIDFPQSEGMLGPIARIMAPLQIGIVATVIGIGLLFIKNHFTDSGAMLLIGTIGLTLGIGFVLSAVFSWILAQRLGVSGKMETRSTDVPQ